VNFVTEVPLRRKLFVWILLAFTKKQCFAIVRRKTSGCSASSSRQINRQIATTVACCLTISPAAYLKQLGLYLRVVRSKDSYSDAELPRCYRLMRGHVIQSMQISSLFSALSIFFEPSFALKKNQKLVLVCGFGVVWSTSGYLIKTI